MSPVRLQEHGIYLFGVDDFDALTHSFNHGSDTEILDCSQGTLGAACYEVLCGFAEGVVWQTYQIELAVNELCDAFGRSRSTVAE
ncbi:MAG: hypothetical protein L3J39_03875 [Verrucomicrobiales bacterium]|nr:hypothetical protein [Verrucomicrobiales bacterium]